MPHRHLAVLLLLCAACTSPHRDDDGAGAERTPMSCHWDAGAPTPCRIEGAGGCCGLASDTVYVRPDSECRAACPDGYVVPELCTTTCEPDPVPCGDETCAPDEYCVEECSGIDAGTHEPPEKHCMPIPTSCSSTDPCTCFCTFDRGESCRLSYVPDARVVQCGCG